MRGEDPPMEIDNGFALEEEEKTTHQSIHFAFSGAGSLSLVCSPAMPASIDYDPDGVIDEDLAHMKNNAACHFLQDCWYGWGIGESLVLASFCCGPYYLIRRALGAEVSVNIGLCFSLGNSVTGSLYVLGAVETFLNVVPGAIFEESITRVAANATQGGIKETIASA